uniref:DNA-directed RNA polymerase subunit alpha n=1 Tax=Cymbomonas tetramitiformis TaxID=36881 RepID=A0A166QIF3_9CHLO|nr:alpha subunit of RNA polymerase [Cymbomonas tetramitiformis]ANA56908.1 alpha subunit of RNA polymerase [Cymbomonas tetramitiformis]
MVVVLQRKDEFRNSNTMNSIKLKLLDFRIEEKCLHYGRFSLGPFNIGQGITVGNSLRRTLISDLPGIAITSVDIRNPVIDHEFSSILGIRESVLEILLNLKEISFIQEGPEKEVSGIINITGSKKITAKDILLPSDSKIRVVDPDQYIATTIDPNIHIELTLTIEQGKGYKCFEDSKPSCGLPSSKAAHPAGVDSSKAALEGWGPGGGNPPPAKKLPIDAIFRPVKKVNFVVEEDNSLSSDNLNKEQIMLEVWTNGSIHPQNALENAANILVHLFSDWSVNLTESFSQNNVTISEDLEDNLTESFSEDLEKDQGKPTALAPENMNNFISSNYEEILIEDLKLSVRSYNCLKRSQIHTVSDLLNYSKENLLEIKNFGLKSADEIIEALQTHLGVCLPKN